MSPHYMRCSPGSSTDYDIGGRSEEYEALVRERGTPVDPRVRCDKARRQLGLQTHSMEDTLFEIGKSLVDLGGGDAATQDRLISPFVSRLVWWLIRRGATGPAKSKSLQS